MFCYATTHCVLADHGNPKKITVDILSPSPSNQQQELMSSLKFHLLEKHKIELSDKLIFWQKQVNWQAHINNSDADYIVTIGQESLYKAMSQEPNRPILALMVTAHTIDTFKQHDHPDIYALTHEQPLVRYFALIKTLDVYQGQIGSFFNKHNQNYKQQYQNVADFYNLPYKPIFANAKLQTKDAIRELTFCCKILLHNSDAVYPPGKYRKSIMYSSYKHRLIVIGHSPSLLGEGAMLALFSQPYKIGEQAAQMLAHIEQNTLKQRYQYPQQFEIEMNRRVAKLLGLSSLTLGQLIDKVNELEYLYLQMEGINGKLGN